LCRLVGLLGCGSPSLASSRLVMLIARSSSVVLTPVCAPSRGLFEHEIPVISNVSDSSTYRTVITPIAPEGPVSLAPGNLKTRKTKPCTGLTGRTQYTPNRGTSFGQFQRVSPVPGFARNNNPLHGLTPVADHTGPFRAANGNRPSTTSQSTVCAPSRGLPVAESPRFPASSTRPSNGSYTPIPSAVSATP